jgi:hypothetical protein
MKKNLLMSSILITLLIGFIVIPLGYAISSEHNKVIAYLYSSKSGAEGYESFLESNGYPTDIFSVEELNSNSLENYDIILIGPHTFGIGGQTWSDPSKVAYIDGLNLPILGIGVGGSCFFSALSLSIGTPEYGGSYLSSVNCSNPKHPIWNIPNNITTSNNLTLYTQDVATYEAVVVEPQENLTIIGRYPLPRYASYIYNLIMEADRYFFWGYNSYAINMNENGKHLFLNVIHYFIGSPTPSIGGYDVFIVIIVASIVVLGIVGHQLKKRHQ